VDGETDLARLLATLTPVRQPGVYVFATVDRELPAEVTMFACVIEPEGRSVVIRADDAVRLGLRSDYQAAWIRLDVHSSLAAVGLTAAVSAKLADLGISCNVIAGSFHDHLLVPASQADEALAALAELVTEAREKG
jgi:uncharacterized protein